MTSQCLSLYTVFQTAAGSRIIHYHFDSEQKWSSTLLIFVIARISVQNTNLPLTVERFELGAKLNVIKSQV